MEKIETFIYDMDQVKAVFSRDQADDVLQRTLLSYLDGVPDLTEEQWVIIYTGLRKTHRAVLDAVYGKEGS